MKKICVFLLFLFPFMTQAQFGGAGAGAPRIAAHPGPVIDPYTFFSTGSYKIGDTDEGDFSGLGIGAKIGFSTERLWFGFDANMIMADPSSNRNLDATTRNANPIFDDKTILSYGVGLGLLMGSFQLSYTHYFNQTYKGRISDPATGVGGDYSYYGKGHKATLDYTFSQGFSIFIEHQQSKFDRYSLSADVGAMSATGKTARNGNLEISTWNFGLSYKIRFGTFQSLMQ